jgi:hypothetical protein
MGFVDDIFTYGAGSQLLVVVAGLVAGGVLKLLNAVIYHHGATSWETQEIKI